MAVNGNPADNIAFGMRVVFSETNFLEGGLSDVSPKIGPATLDLSNISIRDLTLGDAVKLKANTPGIEYQGGDVLLKIRTTLDFGDYLTSTNPITTEMRIGITTTTVNSQTVAKPYFDGSITAFVGNMGPLKFNLTNVKLQGDPLGNFFGLNAQNITMQWASQFGGQSQAGLSGLKLGVDKTRKFTFAVNGGIVQSPPISTGTFSGTQFIGTVGAVSSTLSMTFTGNVNIKIPGGAKDAGGNSVNPSVSLVVRAGKNMRTDCNAAGAPTPCFTRIDGVMTAFSVKLPGFKLALVRPDPFAMTLGAQLKILIFNVASAQMQIGDGAGFNACPPGTPANTPVSQCPPWGLSSQAVSPAPDFAGEVVGMRFRPEIPMLPGVYQATLVGGEDGINTPEGNSMPADYVWTWKQTNTLDAPHRVFIPMVRM